MKTAIKALLVALLPTYAPLCAPAGEARPDFREETIYFVLTDRFADPPTTISTATNTGPATCAITRAGISKA